MVGSYVLRYWVLVFGIRSAAQQFLKSTDALSCHTRPKKFMEEFEIPISDVMMMMINNSLPVPNTSLHINQSWCVLDVSLFICL